MIFTSPFSLAIITHVIRVKVKGLPQATPPAPPPEVTAHMHRQLACWQLLLACIDQGKKFKHLPNTEDKGSLYGEFIFVFFVLL